MERQAHQRAGMWEGHWDKLVQKAEIEEEESRKVEQILGSEMMPAQQDCCDSSEIAEEQRLRQNMV